MYIDIENVKLIFDKIRTSLGNLTVTIGDMSQEFKNTYGTTTSPTKDYVTNEQEFLKKEFDKLLEHFSNVESYMMNVEQNYAKFETNASDIQNAFLEK